MIISRGRSFCFVHIPHTGGSSIELAYAPHRLPSDEIYGPNHPGRHATASDRRGSFLECPEKLVVAVTRNPWERLHSHYWHAMKDLRDGAADNAATPASYVADLRRIAACQTFGAFVRAWLTKPRCSWSHYCCDGSGRDLVNHVLRFDRLAADWESLCGRLGIDAGLPHANRMADRPDYHDAYDAELRDAVGVFCRAEIEAFNYTY